MKSSGVRTLVATKTLTPIKAVTAAGMLTTDSKIQKMIETRITFVKRAKL